MLFNKLQPLRFFLTSKKEVIRRTIEDLEYNYVLNVNEENYIDGLYNQFLIEKIMVNFQDVKSVDNGEKLVEGKDFFGRICKVKRPVIKFMIPVSRNYELLTYYPSTYTSYLRCFTDKNVSLESDYLMFEIISDYDDDFANVNSEYDIFKDYVIANTNNLNKEILAFNESLKSYITSIFKNRKDVLLKRQKAFTGLKVPLKQNVNMSETFSIPFSKPKKRIEIPKVTEVSKHKLDPTLDYNIYEQILKIINDCGKEFERLKKTYQNFKEENFRNNILFVINSHYEGTATGETFNADGKTDILLRYDNSIMFIAECKIWSGISAFKKAIDQLINYLTWRDTKTALIIFVKKEDIAKVINTIKSHINEHSKFKKYVNENDKSWINYEFYLNVEKTIVFNLAVMIYKV